MNFHEVAALVIFCLTVLLTVLLVLFPVSIALPVAWHQKLRIKAISISYAAAPAIGTLVMLAAGVLDGSSLAAGIVGDANMKPYGIVILFMALAYMSSSLDMTGCFQWLALHLTRLSRGNGLALFLLYYFLSSIITVFTSNDVSIMTLTPIIHYFSLATDADPIPFLTAEFTAANIWSMLLFVGNPTNIIVAMAYRLSFVDYTKWMALPTLGAGAVALVAVLLSHWRSIPARLQLPELQPSAMLVDRPGAVLGSINILVCLGLLAAAPALHWELWVITLVCAALHAFYNVIAYVVYKGCWCKSSSSSSGQGGSDVQHLQEAGVQAAAATVPAAAATVAGRLQSQGTGSGIHQFPQLELAPRGVVQQLRTGSAVEADIEVSIEAPDSSSRCSSRVCSRQQLLTVQQHACCSDVQGKSALAGGCTLGDKGCCQGPPREGCSCAGCKTALGCGVGSAAAVPAEGFQQADRSPGLKPPPAPCFWRAVTVLPWEIVPFVLGMFCVVEGLNTNGWVDLLAGWLAGRLGGGVWGALFGIGWLSVLLANIINNQPMTILMTRVCMSPAFTQPLAAAAATAATSHAAAVPLASAFAVVVASNTAANFSVMGALAGIMFVNILQRRGMRAISYVRFSRLMLPAGVTSTLLALLVLGAEFSTWRVG